MTKFDKNSLNSHLHPADERRTGLVSYTPGRLQTEPAVVWPSDDRELWLLLAVTVAVLRVV